MIIEKILHTHLSVPLVNDLLRNFHSRWAERCTNEMKYRYVVSITHHQRFWSDVREQLAKTIYKKFCYQLYWFTLLYNNILHIPKQCSLLPMNIEPFFYILLRHAKELHELLRVQQLPILF